MAVSATTEQTWTGGLVDATKDRSGEFLIGSNIGPLGVDSRSPFQPDAPALYGWQLEQGKDPWGPQVIPDAVSTADAGSEHSVVSSGAGLA